MNEVLGAAVRFVAKLALRGAVGFVCGFIVAIFALEFLGLFPASNDSSLDEIWLQRWSFRVALYIAFGSACATLLLGGIRVSTYWVWFSVVFGIICAIPFWPSKSGTLLPLGTPYVNRGYDARDAVLLATHVGASLVIAWPIHFLVARAGRRRAETHARWTARFIANDMDPRGSA